MAPSVVTYVISAKGSLQQASLRSERSAQNSSSLKTPAKAGLAFSLAESWGKVTRRGIKSTHFFVADNVADCQIYLKNTELK